LGPQKPSLQVPWQQSADVAHLLSSSLHAQLPLVQVPVEH
jgi:hypothetical protein